jgi:hypothetical protein
MLGGGVVNTYDGRLIAIGQPEPEFIRRRYEQATALRDIKRQDQADELASRRSQGFVERIRLALGIA